MFTLYLSAKTLYAYYDGYTSLGVAALAILAVDPFSAYSLSFMLSFAAVLGITAFSQPIKKSLLLFAGLAGGGVCGEHFGAGLHIPDSGCGIWIGSVDRAFG